MAIVVFVFGTPTQQSGTTDQIAFASRTTMGVLKPAHNMSFRGLGSQGFCDRASAAVPGGSRAEAA